MPFVWVPTLHAKEFSPYPKMGAALVESTYHSWTSHISERSGGSFLSCKRRANTCSEWTLLSVRRLTSFISIRGNIKWSCRQQERGRGHSLKPPQSQRHLGWNSDEQSTCSGHAFSDLSKYLNKYCSVFSQKIETERNVAVVANCSSSDSSSRTCTKHKEAIQFHWI